MNLVYFFLVIYNGEEAITKVYGSNFATAYETYKGAVNKDSIIRLQDVKGLSEFSPR